ncbi:MAG: RNA polymerase sigma factor [Bacteroidales bacterium]
MSQAYQEIHKEIIEASKTGDRKSQFMLYKLYANAMFNITMRMMNFKNDEAEDMLQESFIEAFRKLDSYRYESSFGAWLKRIVINKCINQMKKKRVDLVLQDEIPGIYEEPVTFDDENLQLDVQKIHAAMEQLPEGYRVILSLYLFEGYDHVEISEIMNISVSTSKSQYMRAKSKLKDILRSNNIMMNYQYS